jgi:hypothetical protein
MKKWTASLGFTIIATIGVLAASDRTSVTITGCVQHGDTPGTYVLTHLAETSPQARNPARAIYWLTSTKGLRAQIGHMVQVTGLVSAEDDAGKTGTIKVKTSAKGQEKIAVETATRKAEVTLATPVATDGVKSRTEVEKPLRTLHVRSITMLAGGRCQ